MAEPKRIVRVAVALTLAEASVLARAAVVVTSSLDCKDVNAAEQGLRTFRDAVGQALASDVSRGGNGDEQHGLVRRTSSASRRAS